MEYRVTDPEDDDYGDEDGVGMHEFIDRQMHGMSPDDLMDTLLMIANASEARAMTHQFSPDALAWYSKLGAHLRGVLESMTSDSSYGLPDSQLENPMLYYPPPDGTTH